MKLTAYRKEEYIFTGPDLKKVRLSLDLTEYEFATRCGWPRMQQRKLEIAGIKHNLSPAIKAGLIRGGIEIEYDA